MINFIANAATLENPAGANFNSLASIVNAFVTPVLTIAGLVLFLLIVVSGFKFMTAGDDPKAKGSAKAQLTSAVIGFVIIFSAYWVVEIIASILGIETQILGT